MIDAAASALKDAGDKETAIEAVRELSAALKSKKAQGADKVPSGTVKLICSQMTGYLSSLEMVGACLTCLGALMATPSRAGMMLRLEGGVKGLSQVIKRHLERSKVVGPALKLLLRACANSPQTLLAVMKEKGLVLAVLDCFRLQIRDLAIASTCLELSVLLTRYEKGARLLAGEGFVDACSQVMMIYVGHWDLFGYALKTLKNIAKFDEPRAVLLRDTEVRKLLLGASKVVARVPEKQKLLKRAFRGLWMLSSEALSPMPDPEPEVYVMDEDVNSDIPSALECVYDRDCQLFPELLDGQVVPSDPAPEVPAINACRELMEMAEQPLTAEMFAAASRPYSSQPEIYHTGGACLVQEMMMHDLQRLANPERVKNTLVYDSQAGYVGPASQGACCLRFESRFETANLRAAAQVFEAEYDLWLATDLNEREDPGHRQWFYFAVSGAQPGVEYKFNLVNMVKKDSLVNSGLNPLVARGIPAATRRRSLLEEPDANLPSMNQWRRAGSNCCYYPSPYRSPPSDPSTKSGGKSKGKAGAKVMTKSSSGKGSTSSLSTNAPAQAAPSPTDLLPTNQLVGRGLFCHTFSLSFDSMGTYFVAMCFPYSYSDVQEHLARVSLSFRGGSRLSMVVRRSLLCRTLLRHRCDLLTITDFTSEESEAASREYVVISARVHPGETNSSWVMKGLVDFLTSQHPTARSMRQSFIFKIIPCLNPDGVILGNYRCGLAGVDLNRTWDKPDKVLHPTIWHTRALVQRLGSTGRLALFCDLHGHSRREDAFFYGCDPPTGSGALTDAKAPVLGPQREEAERAASREKEAAGEVDADPNQGAAKALPARDVARLRVRMLPYLMSKIDQGVSFNKCTFKVARSKMSTGRVVVCRTMRVAGSYTLETSLGGCSKTGMHFGGADLMRLGRSLCEAISELADVDEDQLLDEMASSIDFSGRK